MYETRPPINNIPFKFGSSGYSKPNFNGINFSFPSKLCDLKAAIIGSELDRDYLKSCKEYVIGYSSNELQVIKYGCVYGGIRDLQILLKVSIPFKDLHAYLKQVYTEQFDIAKTIKGLVKSSKNLANTIKMWVSTYDDLSVYLKQGISADKFLLSYIKTFFNQQYTLSEMIKGWSIGNIVDIVNTIRIWHEDIKDIPIYLKTTINESVNLFTIVYKIWQRNQTSISNIIHGWQELQLGNVIQSLHIKNLPILIRPAYFSILNAFLYAVRPVNMSANLVGWAYNDLSVSIFKGTYDGDLSTTIFGIKPRNLLVSIKAFKGLKIPVNLNAIMTNLLTYNLICSLNSIQYNDLNVLLTSSRDVIDLICKIYPKIVCVKQHINISFLENRDLAGIINFPCFNSAFKDLLITVVIKNSKNLKINIYGYDNSNIKNLSCFINASDYISQNTIELKYIPKCKIESFTKLKISHKPFIYSINTVNTWFNCINKFYSNLPCMLNGEYLTKDLPVFLRAYSNRHFSSTNIRNKIITLKLKNNQEDFRRYVELAFKSYAKSYSYFTGNKKAYRNYKNDHWIVNVEGYKLLPVGKGFEKSKVKRKYLFNLKNYTTIDEALKDMIDRVTTMRFYDLNAYIEVTNDRMSNLFASIKIKNIFKTNRILNNSIKGVNTVINNLFIEVTSILNKSSYNLANSITGISYNPPKQGEVDFNFIGSGDIKLSSIDANFKFN